jgi:hypothetical protein
MRFTLAALLLGLTIGVAAQKEKTIPEIVKAGQDPSMGINVDIMRANLDELATSSALIVRGLILGSNAHLSTDETTIVTDINVQVIERLHARGAIKHRQTIVVTREGGTVMVEGKRVSIGTGFPPVQVNDEYIFFLRPNPDETYSLVAGPQGLFKNLGGEVEEVGYGFYKARGHVPLGLFIKELNDALNHEGQGRGGK